MNFFKSIAKVSLAMFVLLSCEGPEPGKLGPKQPWMKGNYQDKYQIVFTNDYGFKDGRATIGASSFLVHGKKGVVLCTAKHLLGSAMGINPEVKTTKFNAQVDYWNVYAKNDQLFKDTLSVSKLINTRLSSADIVLMKCAPTKGKNLLALKPRFSRIGEDEELTIIGYKYGDPSGKQIRVKVNYDEYDKSTLLVQAESIIQAIGMSGAPVIDASGYVVGVLVGGGVFEDKMYLSVEPLSKVKKYLE